MDRSINDTSNASHTTRLKTDIKAGISDPTDLPYDIFLLIVDHFTPTDSVICRRVSRAWHVAFTDDELGWRLMKRHFPRVREVRNTTRTQYQSRWADTFLEVAHRYHNLRLAKPRSLERIDIGPDIKQGGLFQPVEPWCRRLWWKHHTSVFQGREPSWCLDDGLLVYRRPKSDDYVAYDLDTKQLCTIPFRGEGKIVRRLRLAHGILIVEWCEWEPSRSTGGSVVLHRHYMTAFDVRRSAELGPTPSGIRGSWEISFRSEWKLHPAELRINDRDRFFSAHTQTHYALYIWRFFDDIPNHQNIPAERLTIWDIRKAAPDRSSAGGAEGSRTSDGTESPKEPMEPKIIRRFDGDDLEFFGIRQKCTPMLREILLDEANIYVHEETHPWLSGRHAPVQPPRVHHVRATGIPILGAGPPWVDRCCAEGDIHMNFCPRAGSAARLGGADYDDYDGSRHDVSSLPLSWPSSSSSPSLSHYFDATWPGWAPCWRHDEFPYLTVSEVVDARAGVRIAARQCFVMEALSSFVLPRISSILATREKAEQQPDDADGARFADGLWTRLLGKGRIAGDERWVVGDDADLTGVTVMRF